MNSCRTIRGPVLSPKSVNLRRLLLLIVSNSATSINQEYSFDPFLESLRALPNSSLQIIGTGQGTSGTHSLYHELCAMGFSSWHYGESCNPKKQEAALKFEDFHTNKLNFHPDKFVVALRKSILENLAVLVDGAAEAVLDSPVSYMYDELRLSFPSASVILTTRNSTDWASNRLRGHHKALLCRESVPSLLLGVDHAALLGATEAEGPPLPHPFALRACAERHATRHAPGALCGGSGDDSGATRPWAHRRRRQLGSRGASLTARHSSPHWQGSKVALARCPNTHAVLGDVCGVAPFSSVASAEPVSLDGGRASPSEGAGRPRGEATARTKKKDKKRPLPASLNPFMSLHELQSLFLALAPERQQFSPTPGTLATGGPTALDRSKGETTATGGAHLNSQWDTDHGMTGVCLPAGMNATVALARAYDLYQAHVRRTASGAPHAQGPTPQTMNTSSSSTANSALNSIRGNSSLANSSSFFEMDLWRDDACALHSALEGLFNRKVAPSWRGDYFGAPVGNKHKRSKSRDELTSEPSRYSFLDVTSKSTKSPVYTGDCPVD